MKQILCFGDSNTWGYDGESRERLPWGVRWTSLLQEKLNKEEYRVIEEGLCGRTTVFEDPLRDGRKGTALLPTLLETHAQADVITLMLGTNDCKTVFGASADVIGKGIIRLLDQVQEYAPKAKVLLMAPIYLGEKVWQEGYDQEFSRSSSSHFSFFSLSSENLLPDSHSFRPRIRIPSSACPDSMSFQNTL